MRLLGLFLLAAALCAQQKKIVVIAHRGEHLRNPENTLPAFEEAIRLGADFIEVDVRTTADGKLVLMHDDTVDRRTNGKGAVKLLTLEQIRALDAGAGTRVPTFDEALGLARGRIGVYVDVKEAAPQAIVAALERFDFDDHAVIYGGVPFLKAVAALKPRLMVMPESVSVAHTRMLVETLRPRVIAFSARDFTDEIIAEAKHAGVLIYVDRLGRDDNEAAWQDAVDRGADGIQTDRPAELIRYLKSRGYR